MLYHKANRPDETVFYGIIIYFKFPTQGSVVLDIMKHELQYSLYSHHYCVDSCYFLSDCLRNGIYLTLLQRPLSTVLFWSTVDNGRCVDARFYARYIFY